jgi:hypothetical protein
MNWRVSLTAFFIKFSGSQLPKSTDDCGAQEWAIDLEYTFSENIRQ